MSDSTELAVREVADRAAITELIYRFAHGLDHHDPDMVASCFTDDAVFVLDGEPRQVSELKPGSRQDAVALKRSTGLDRLDASTHAMTDVAIQLSGDSATVECVTLTTLVGTRDEEPTLLFRGIRLYDECVRHGQEWRIAIRRHELLWMFEGVPTKVGHS